jgi:hypothetical protein
MHFTLIKSNIHKSKINLLISGFILLIVQACTNDVRTRSLADLPGEESFSVIRRGTKVGYLKVARSGDTLITGYDYKNNGRGPTIKDTITLNKDGFPVKWDISGNTTFGNTIDEHYELKGAIAYWKDATGSSEAKIEQPMLYIDQMGSPYSHFINAWVLLNAPDQTLPALPSGQLQLTALETFRSSSGAMQIELTSYAMTGADLNPTYFILDENQLLFALITPRIIIIRTGFEDEKERIRSLSEKYATERYENIQSQYAHKYEKDIRIGNIRIFDPKTLSLTEPSSILIRDKKIFRIDAPNASGVDEVTIDGKGGVIVPGLYDMHMHTRDERPLFNVLAGVTSVRDMGNDNEALDSLIYKIESGILAGPRITRLGFIEGESPFSSSSGILVESEEEALAAVETYAEKGFYGVKLYNSMKGDWVPAIVKRAHELDLFVCGHVPAFSNANDMLKAGFDEMTHINQLMFAWVLEQNEDTRTLLRLTAMKRFPEINVNSLEVNETLDLMTNSNVAIDPTLAIHESLMLSRNGETQPSMLDYIENMPANTQRSAKVARANIADEEEDRAYRLAFDKIVETLKTIKSRGILIVPGTDMGGGFHLHRELELYLQLGYTPAELLKLASYDMAQYLGHADRGILEPGMLADFFLVPDDPTQDIKAIKTISMVSRGGVIYFPSEIYPSFGIKPFVDIPVVN